MAEKVQQHMEDMLPEISCMEEINLLTKPEIQKILLDRRELEYKLIRPKREKADFIAYAAYDINLLAKLAQIREKLNISTYKDEIEGSIRKRVVKRFEALTYTFHNDIHCWGFRINFCKSQKELRKMVTGIFDQQVKLVGYHEGIWIEWAKWEMLGKNDFAEARKVLSSRASCYYPRSIYLAREHFRLELLYIEHLTNITDEDKIKSLSDVTLENREKVLKGEIASIVYENARKTHNKAEVNSEFYLVAEIFSFAKDIQNKIRRDMVELYPKEADTWLIQARHALTRSRKNLHVEKILRHFDRGLEEIGQPFVDVYINEVLNFLFHFWMNKVARNAAIEKLKSLLESRRQLLKTSFPWMLWISLLDLEGSSVEDKKAILKDAANLVPRCSLIEQTLLDCQSGVETDILKIKGIKKCRKFYKKKVEEVFSCFSQTHSDMLSRELQRKEISVEDVRYVFNEAVRRCRYNPLVWLAYANFEYKYGSRIKSIKTEKDAKMNLSIQKFAEFEQLEMCLKDKVLSDMNLDDEPVLTSWEPSIFLDSSILKDEDDTKLEGDDDTKLRQMLPAEAERQSFFGKLKEIKKRIAKNENVAKIDDDKRWRKVIETILGRTVSFDSVFGPRHRYFIEEETRQNVADLANAVIEDKTVYSTELVNKNEYEPIVDKDMEEYAKKSDILDPVYLAQRTLPPHHVSKFAKKNQRKHNVPTTAGKGWFDMKSPKITPQIEKELAAFNMRSALLPHRHYNKSSKKNPVFFQLGRYVNSSPYDFYDRVPKKQRKNTFVEELMSNEEVISYQKKKFREISVRSEAKRKRIQMAKSSNKRRKTDKNK